MAGTKPRPSAFSFACPSCGAPVPVHAPSLTVAVSCASCAALIDVTSEGNRILEGAKKNGRRILPIIELGKKGVLRGRAWQVIGFMRRTEQNAEQYPWDEYLLFNPRYGYRWLVRTSQDHWTFVRSIKNGPTAAMGVLKVEFEGRTYRKFNYGNVRIDYVVGEFYWQAKIGQVVSAMDAVSPPYMLSREKTRLEDVWSFAEYIEPKEIAAAFGLTSLPKPQGIGPCQPQGRDPGTPFEWLKTMGMGLVLALVLQLVSGAFGTETKAFMKNINGADVADAAVRGAQSHNVGTFDLTNARGAVALDLSANLSNAWMAVGVNLVNEATGEIREFNKELSFYSGSDSDGSWVESDLNARLVAGPLAPGKWTAYVELEVPPGTRPDFTVVGQINPHPWSNFWLAAFLIAIPGFFFFWRGLRFETERWSQSDYNPYQKQIAFGSGD